MIEFLILWFFQSYLRDVRKGVNSRIRSELFRGGGGGAKNWKLTTQIGAFSILKVNFSYYEYFYCLKNVYFWKFLNWKYNFVIAEGMWEQNVPTPPLWSTI